MRQLRTGPGVIDRDFVALYRQLTLDEYRLVEAVVLHGRAIDAIRDLADGSAHRIFRTQPHLGAERIEVHGLQQALKPLAHGAAARDLGPDVAEPLLRDAHVLGDDLDQDIVRLAAVEQPHQRNLQTFFIDLATRVAAKLAADVGQMRHDRGEPDQLTAVKDRRRGGDVVHMPRSLPRIIGDEHVAGLHGIGRKFFEEGAHGRRQTTDEAGKTHGGLRQRASLCISQHDGEVVSITHQRREAGPDERGGGLVDHADQALPEDFQFDRIERRDAVVAFHRARQFRKIALHLNRTP